AAEKATVDQFKVFHSFQFADRLPESGITFVHGIVEDAGKRYKAAHYDHGTCLAVADVDGDGRLDLYFVNQLGGNELWKNLGNGKWKNVTAEAGVGLGTASRSPPPSRISTTTAIRTSTSPGSAAATSSSRTTARGTSRTSPRSRAW